VRARHVGQQGRVLEAVPLRERSEVWRRQRRDRGDHAWHARVGQDQLELLEPVLAPGAGRVLKVPISEGSVAMPGETIATIAADNYILRLQLPERHAQFMKTGDTILIGARGLQVQEQETLRRGRVVLVYPAIEQGRVIADVEVEGLGDYFVGERTRVYIATGTREALAVPEDDVYRRFGVSYVKLKDGTEVVVQVGLPVEGGIDILAGLHEGDVVIAP